MTHELWAGLNDHIFTFLRSVSLAQLVAQQEPDSEVAVLQDHRLSPPSRAPETLPVA